MDNPVVRQVVSVYAHFTCGLHAVLSCNLLRLITNGQHSPWFNRNYLSIIWVEPTIQRSTSWSKSINFIGDVSLGGPISDKVSTHIQKARLVLSNIRYLRWRLDTIKDRVCSQAMRDDLLYGTKTQLLRPEDMKNFGCLNIVAFEFSVK